MKRDTKVIEPQAVDPNALGDAEALESLRRDMLRFAQIQLRDHALAEDVVQDALLKAMRKRDSFAGRSSLKTWVFAILRNTLINAVRSRSRFVDVTGVNSEGEQMDFDRLFDQRGMWAPEARPGEWAEPSNAIESKEFWVVFEICLHDLPENTSRVFMMREFMDLTTDEICAATGISVSNCHVILHRARMGLRECLRKKWFEAEAA